MKHLARVRAAAGRLDVFAAVERLLTAASLVLVAITVGGEVGQMLGLAGVVGTVVAWSIALVYDALWIGALRMSEVAIRQRSKVGMVVMLGLSAVAVTTSTVVLLVLGHASVFAFVPVAAAVFMGLRLFAGHVLADADTADRIAAQDAADRNARALARAEARHLRSGAETDVVTETAEHLAEMARQIARAEVLTVAQVEIDAARAKAEKRLAKAGEKHGELAAAFTSRDLMLAPSRPAVTAGTVTAVTPDIDTGVTTRPVTGVTQAKGEIEAVTTTPVTGCDTEDDAPTGQAPATGAATLEELAAVAGVELPRPGVTLSDEQLAVVLRWLRYSMEPPRSYRQAQTAFRGSGFIGGEHRVRRIWGEIETAEVGAQQ